MKKKLIKGALVAIATISFFALFGVAENAGTQIIWTASAAAVLVLSTKAYNKLENNG